MTVPDESRLFDFCTTKTGLFDLQTQFFQSHPLLFTIDPVTAQSAADFDRQLDNQSRDQDQSNRQTEAAPGTCLQRAK
jgi:hypothetical protein